MKLFIVLAGGLGTRISAVENRVPKTLIDINGRPFLEYKLEELRAYNPDLVVISTGYMGSQVYDFIRTYVSSFPIVLLPDLEGDAGTFVPIKRISRGIKQLKHLYVTYGDSLVGDCASLLEQIHLESHQSLLVGSTNFPKGDLPNLFFPNQSETTARYGNSSEASHVEHGVMKLSVESIMKYDQAPLTELPRFLEAESHLGNLHGVTVSHPYLEIGRPDALKKTKSILSDPFFSGH